MMSYQCKLTSSFFLLLCSISFVRPEETGPLTEAVLAKKINWLGCNLLNKLYADAAPEDNILVSPVNNYAALALLHLGTAEKTRDELAAIMKLSDNKNFTEIHQQVKAVLSKLSSKPHNPKFHETVLANALFLQNDFPVKESYLEQAKKYYDAVAKNVDFGKNAQEATDTVNKWISDATKGRIAKFYEQPLTSDTIAVLTSALYFNAKWKNTFSPENTKEEKFNTGVTQVQTPTMSKNATLLYENDDVLHYESVTLPYSGGEYEMTVYLQHQQHGDHGSLAHLFHELSQKNFDTSNCSYRVVDLKLPKMKFSWKKSVVDALKLKDIFNAPNLSELTSQPNVKISDMIHATELEVDEEGTVATAATAIEMILFSALVPAKPEPVKFHVDRPFLVTIRHEPTNLILFAGVVRKPFK